MAHILVIDDDKMICDLLRRTLERSGYRVTEAHDGQMALNAHKANAADLVITDMIMPGMEGIQTIMEFRRLNPALKIIAMSGGGMGKSADYLNMAKKFGAFHTLAKPFTIERVTKLVGDVLAGAVADGTRKAKPESDKP